MDSRLEGYIEYFNEQQAQEKLPNTIFIGILLVFGIVGNTTVLFIYKLKLKRIRNVRYFIIAIAFTDLTASVFGGTSTILQNTYTASFPSGALCKGLRYISASLSGISAFLLTIIAISRYYKICEPTKTVRFLKKIKLTVSITVIFAALGGIPFIFLRGLRPFDVEAFNSTVTGFSCTDVEISVTSLKVLKYIYNGIILFIIILSGVVICVMYAKIGRIIYRKVGTFGQKTDISANTVSDGRNNINNLRESHLTIEPVTTRIVRTNNDSNELNTKPANLAMSARKRIKRTRNNFTNMFICVTFTYIGTYLPSVAFLIIQGENPTKFWSELPPVKLNVFLTLKRMYMFAHASNPFIYLYFDFDFRRALIDLIRKGKICLALKGN